MKTKFMGVMALGVLFGFGAVGCSTGKPGFRSETLRPDQQHDFAVLYKKNCSACHGDRGLHGAALPLDNPVYLTWAGHDRLIGIVANGVPHRLMPAFGPGGGGLLTDQQVEDIVHGMISQWSKPATSNGANVPAYSPTAAGDIQQGHAAFQFYCARCHGADGAGISAGTSAAARSAAADKGSTVGSIVDPTYLALISRQALRDIIVSGVPGENMPDWRGDVAGRPMTDKDITDVVAWLVSHRVQFPGQPFPSSSQHPETAQHPAGREGILKNPLKDIIKNPMNEPSEHSRRKFLMWVAVGLNGLVGLVLAVPVIGYIFGPVFTRNQDWNHWVPVGNLKQFPKGETRLGQYRNPDTTPADGQTQTLPCWVRNIDDKQFQVFAINCAHMECPVHWFPQSKLFMCPCHGGVYYQDGAVAAGPPPRGLYEYKYKVIGNQLLIWAGELPTLSTQASVARPGSSPCLG